MNNQENDSIHNFDFSLICEFFSLSSRQGPGSTASTHQALSYIPDISSDFRIADIGCGTGSSAIQLAKETHASVLAIDLFPEFLEKVKANAISIGVADNVSTLLADMTHLPLKEESLDMIWSEGAIYNIGFEKGLHEWRRFLRSKGYIAVTESTWLSDSRPKEIEDFWMDAYPQIDTFENNKAKFVNAGYRLIGSFTLPTECWTTNYYEPQVKAKEIFLNRHRGNSTADELIKNLQREAELYAKYHQYYGYVWYIGQKL